MPPTPVHLRLIFAEEEPSCWYGHILAILDVEDIEVFVVIASTERKVDTCSTSVHVDLEHGAVAICPLFALEDEKAKNIGQAILEEVLVIRREKTCTVFDLEFSRSFDLRMRDVLKLIGVGATVSEEPGGRHDRAISF